ncbi:MAG: protocatechuate 3,4-dioxygenase subunit beta [Rhizobiaceae bacterium]|nr:protocatechuate 3,4-dioxygenase subunit beta [Rhizobiaceae bacterium]
MTANISKPAAGFYQRDRTWQPPAHTPKYKTSIVRSPRLAPISLDTTISEITGPRFDHNIIGELDNDLIRNYAKDDGSPIGERIIVYGRILDENGRGIPDCLIEMWQANSAGRYRHLNDGTRPPLDPNFGGCGRTITDANGAYQFATIKPGPYPWPNGPNDWRPSHIHFSLFGHAFAQRLITQMYFEGDPLIWHCPIIGSIPSKEAIETLIAPLDLANTIPMDSIAYKFDMVLRGQRSTYFEN